MPLAAGDRLGPYEIISPLGAGGMGEVYKARDTRLERLVAIKILPQEKTANEDRKRRFVQEAKAASALNHPNIVAIYDVGSENGVDFLVMELVPGRSLDQLTPRAGMRVSEILRIGAQVADAFSKAHAAGIVHRDLKPGNVMVTPEGQAKILDFGLAKLMQRADAERDATRTIVGHTDEGTVIGTTSYMSPEQAEGKPVDARSDIFSFGALLYEMATGQRAFQGETAMSTISSILRDEPKAVGDLRDDVPPQLIRVINRCLRKDPARRFQGMADLKVELEELKEESDSGKLASPISKLPPARGRSWKTAAWIGAVVVAVVLATAASLRFWSTPPPDPPLAPIPLTTYPGSEYWPTFSPDGSQVAFSWTGEKGDNWDIYVKLIGPGAPLRITTDGLDDTNPSWSPDGRWIAFERWISRTEIAVILVPPLGGPERRITQLYTNPNLYNDLSGICWTRDSRSLIVSGAEQQNQPNRLYLVTVETGDQRPLTNPPSQMVGDGAPSLSPNDRTIAFRREGGMNVGNLYLLQVSSEVKPIGEPKIVAAEGVSPRTPVWTADGKDIVFASGERMTSKLYRIPASAKTPPVLLAWAGIGVGQQAISWSSRRMTFSSFGQNSIIYRSSSDGKGPAEKLIASTAREVFPQYSPDGKRIVFYSNRTGAVQIWMANADGSGAQQITSLSGPTTGSPRWSPDGRSIAFDSNTGGAWQIYVMSANGGKPRQMTADNFANFTANWSQDGRWIYYSSNRTGEQQIWKVPVEGGQPVPVTKSQAGWPSESPDGKWLYFVKDDGVSGLWKMPVEGGSATRVVDQLWRGDYALTDRGVYFAVRQKTASSESSIRYLDFATNRIQPIRSLDNIVDLGLAISPDGRYLLWPQIDHRTADLMLVENFR